MCVCAAFDISDLAVSHLPSTNSYSKGKVLNFSWDEEQEGGQMRRDRTWATSQGSSMQISILANIFVHGFLHLPHTWKELAFLQFVPMPPTVVQITSWSTENAYRFLLQIQGNAENGMRHRFHLPEKLWACGCGGCILSKETASFIPFWPWRYMHWNFRKVGN